MTDRTGIARFDLQPASGQVLVSGIERYHGRLDGDILVELWSITQGGGDSRGNPGEFPSGSNAYSGMSVQSLRIGDREGARAALGGGIEGFGPSFRPRTDSPARKRAGRERSSLSHPAS